jgi:hypothetical protein
MIMDMTSSGLGNGRGASERTAPPDTQESELARLLARLTPPHANRGSADAAALRRLTAAVAVIAPEIFADASVEAIAAAVGVTVRALSRDMAAVESILRRADR